MSQRKSDILKVKLGTVNKVTEAGWRMPADVMQKAIDERFRDGATVLGCLGESGLPIKLKEVTHQVLRAWIEGDTIMGEIRLIGDNLARAKVEAMEFISCSSVGYGTTKDEGGTLVVQDGYILTTFNIREGGEQ